MPDTRLAIGDMCLLDLVEYNPDELQIAKVLAIESDNVEIQWYQGSKSSKIKPFILQEKGKGKIPWKQTVNRKTIWHYGFSLTKSGLLTTETPKAIQDSHDY